jgi:predicted DNA-binding transcriptional regulator YafY
VVKAGVWYVVGYRDGEARMFRVSRATEVEPIGPAQLPPDAPPLVELWDRLRTAFERPEPGAWVTLRVARDGVGWVMGACSQAVVAEPERSADPDDADQIVLRLGFRSLDGARYALTSVAADIDVLDPPALRAAFAAIGQAMAARHADPGSTVTP